MILRAESLICASLSRATSRFFDELKRRNVYKVAIAYAVAVYVGSAIRKKKLTG